jgi:hypothetical protein
MYNILLLLDCKLWLGLYRFCHRPSKILRTTNRALRALMDGVVHKISPARRKLQGYEFYREVLGSPRYIVAPMVDQSELVSDVKPQRTWPLTVPFGCRHGGHYPGVTVLK